MERDTAREANNPTAKKSLGQQNHDEAARIHGRIERRCEPAIALGMQKIHDHLNAHYSAGKPGMYLKTILPLVRAELDEPIAAWLANLGETSFLFSDMLDTRGSGGSLYFDQMVEKKERVHGPNYDSLFPNLIPTANSLINFSSYCCCHRSNNEQILQIKIDEDPGTPPIIDVGKKRGKRSGGVDKRREKMGIDVSIDFSNLKTDLHYCQLCTKLNTRANELLRLFHPSADAQITENNRQKIRDTDLRIHIPGYSPHYCSDHDPERDPVGYNRAHTKRKIYYSMRRFIIMARQAVPHLGLGYLHIIRAASFIITNECPDQSLIQSVPDIVSDWHNEWEGGERPDPSSQRIREQMENIADAFRKADLPVSKFVDAVAHGSTAKLYDESKACQAFSDYIENLIDTGFIYCPITSHLLKGRTITIYGPLTDYLDE